MVLRAIARTMLRPFSRFGRAKRGSVAVEFGLLAIPFFLLTFGVAEIAMVGLAQSSLDHSVQNLIRGIRTGQVQTNQITYAQMQEDLCDGINDFLTLNCDDTLYLDVDTFDSFVNATNTSPIENGVLQTNQFGFAPGGSSSIVVVRAYYRWRPLTPMFENLIQNTTNGERVLVSAMMFRNEPF
jgi:Flp pilus assembly protein TadG